MKNYGGETDPGHGDRVTLQVVERIAFAEGLDPSDLPPLFPVIDLEALATFIESAPPDTTVSFSVDGYDIEVSGDGTVCLDCTPDP
jgi:hypothetical protein